MIALRAGIILLTVATAVLHIVLGVPLFILNGIGYLGLLGLLYLPIPFLAGYRRPIRWVLILYTALTVVLYFALNGFAFQATGYADKAIEIVLIALLLVEDRVATREGQPA